MKPTKIDDAIIHLTALRELHGNLPIQWSDTFNQVNMKFVTSGEHLTPVILVQSVNVPKKPEE